MELALLLPMLAVAAASADTQPPVYADKMNLMVYADEQGQLHPVTNLAEWQRRRAHIVAAMEQVMGPLPNRPAPAVLNMTIEEEVDCGSFVRKRITFPVEDWDRLPAYLLLPKNPEGKVAGVLCLHPTSPFGKKMVVGLGDKPNRNYAEELAARGYVTLAPDYAGFGDYVDARQALYERGYISATMKGIWNHMRCVDLLQGLPEVDPNRIGCIGHSLGGHNTLFVGVFDQRIKVMVTSCGFNLFAKYKGGDLTGWSHDGYMPRIAEVYDVDPSKMPFDFTEVLGALAPRPVFVNAPLNDANFEVSGVRDCIQAAHPVYALYGADADLVAAYPDAEHDFPMEVRAQAYAFMDRVLGME